MVLKSETIFLVMLLICELCNFSLAIHISRPHILSNEEKPNYNFPILCKKNKPLYWTPLVTQEMEIKRWTLFETEEKVHSYSTYPLGFYLNITNISSPFVGEYDCHYSSANDINDDDSGTISLYLKVINSSMTHILQKGMEYIIEPNSNHTIFCQGNQPLKWTTPVIEDEEINKWTIFRTEHEKPINKEFKYGLRLYITNMSYPFVGFYNCHFDNASSINDTNDENDRIYLYVNDKNFLSVEHAEQTIYLAKGDNAVIPCRPTSPDVNVTLQKGLLSGIKKVSINVLKDGTIYRYDPFCGFFTNDTNSILQPEYICVFRRDKMENSLSVILIIEEKISELPATNIVDKNKGLTVEGGKIWLRCFKPTSNTVEFSWITPRGLVRTKSYPYLDIYDITKSDAGVYTCNVSDHQGHFTTASITINIFGKDEHFIHINNTNNYIETKVGEDITLSADVWGYPKSNFTWFKKINLPLKNDKKYKTMVTSSQTRNIARLNINNVAIEDSGNYTLVGRNDFVTKKVTFVVNVIGKPTLLSKTDEFLLIGVENKVKCSAKGNPIPKFQWEYKHCLRPECKYLPMKSQVVENIGYKITSEIKINATVSGSARCTAINGQGDDTNTILCHVSDVPDGFAISGFADTAIVDPNFKRVTYALGENMNMKCSASFPYYNQITWLLNNTAIKQTKRIKIISSYTNYSKSLTLEIDNSTQDNSGTYTCQVFTSDTIKNKKSIDLLVKDPIKTRIKETNMDKEIIVDFSKSLNMICKFEGLPKPQITWYKDGHIFEPIGPRVHFEQDRQILMFNETVMKDAGKYKCEVASKENVENVEVSLQFKNAPQGIQNWLICLLVLLVVALVTLMIILTVKVRKERRLKREMQLLGLATFEKGAVESINPELGIDDQAELLPYDKKWEFPIEQLKLGKQLGSGAFGVVLKGEAKYIVEGEPLTTVAVKMVKKNADNIYLKALASELKIMVHLGKHLNVVNLLGACTKNVAKRELLVIVEYCRFGNLQNYLLKHRENFINQIDPQTGKVNYLIGQEFLNRTYSVSSNTSNNVNSPVMKYAKLAFSDSANNTSFSTTPSPMGDYRAQSNNEFLETSTPGEESVMLSNNSIQPEWRSNYTGDYKGNVHPISTKDLIAYAFQVARGMEYLASRKVLHGDLAARNILLNEDHIVKICDFGLAKSMYKNENYRKRGDCPLPVKWMAIESIRDRVFSTQSDCWSFGIVLWELFSIGKTPYPGMQADEILYQKLLDGYRLESPEFCPKEIYKMMTECWNVKPNLRPSFSKLTERIGTLLEDTLRRHYIDLNDPYLAVNTKMLEEQSDYLSMLSPPNFDSIVSPHYVNDMVTQSTPSDDDGYMSMKPNTIFSPRITDDMVFNFNVKNRKNSSSAKSNDDAHEMLPMLAHIPESTCDDSLNHSDAVSNPVYHISPTLIDKPDETIIKSIDNYVNMPQNKSLLKDKPINDDKSKLIIEDDQETCHYINENSRDWSSIKV